MFKPCTLILHTVNNRDALWPALELAHVSFVSLKSRGCSDFMQTPGWISNLDLRPLHFWGFCFLFLPEPNIWHFWDDEETETWGKCSVH